MPSRQKGLRGDPLHEEGMKGAYRADAMNPTQIQSPTDKDQFALFRKQITEKCHTIHAPNEDGR